MRKETRYRERGGEREREKWKERVCERETQFVVLGEKKIVFK